jgi:hypothetical protein
LDSLRLCMNVGLRLTQPLLSSSVT